MGKEDPNANVSMFRLPTAAAGCYWCSSSVTLLALLASDPQNLLFATD